jgi:transcriptional regulator with XRE-family HTH domain
MNVIVRRRLSRQLQQHELATLVGVRRETVSRWESGTSTPSKANRVDLAKRLGGSPHDYDHPAHPNDVTDDDLAQLSAVIAKISANVANDPAAPPGSDYLLGICQQIVDAARAGTHMLTVEGLDLAIKFITDAGTYRLANFGQDIYADDRAWALEILSKVRGGQPIKRSPSGPGSVHPVWSPGPRD